MIITIGPLSNCLTIEQEVDYPAAHSMDCTWWAIDRDGAVAVFDTWEAGARPILLPIDLLDLYDDRDILPNCSARHICWSGIQYEPMVTETHINNRAYGITALIDDPDIANRLPGHVNITPAGNDTYILHAITQEQAKVLHDNNWCLRCAMAYIHSLDERHSYGQRGIYEYVHLTDNWAAGPYGQLERPLTPIHVDMLRPHYRNQLKEHPLDVSFATDMTIQPYETKLVGSATYLECSSWGDTFIPCGAKNQIHTDMLDTHLSLLDIYKDKKPEQRISLALVDGIIDQETAAKLHEHKFED